MRPHHCMMCSGLDIASNTSRRGASNRRVMRISRFDGVVSANVSLFAALLTAMSLLLRFEFLQIDFQSIEPLLPGGAVALDPFGDVLQRRGPQAAGAPLRFAPAC